MALGMQLAVAGLSANLALRIHLNGVCVCFCSFQACLMWECAPVLANDKLRGL